MHFRGIQLEVVSAFRNSAGNDQPWSLFTGYVEVISYHLSTWIKSHRIEGLGATGMMIHLVQADVGPKTFWWDNTFCVALTTPSAAELRALRDPGDIYAALMQATETGLEIAAAEINLDDGPLQTHLRQLPDLDYTVVHTLCQRNPRGLGLSFAFEAHMTRHALAVDFVVPDQAGVRYRETVQRSAPRA